MSKKTKKPAKKTEKKFIEDCCLTCIFIKIGSVDFNNFCTRHREYIKKLRKMNILTPEVDVCSKYIPQMR